MQEWVYIALICITTQGPDYKAEEEVTKHLCNQLQSTKVLTFKECEQKRKNFELQITREYPQAYFKISLCVRRAEKSIGMCKGYTVPLPRQNKKK